MDTEQLSIRMIYPSEIPQVLTLIDQFDRVQAPHPDAARQSVILEAMEQTGGGVVGVFEGEKLLATCTLNVCPNLSWSGRSYAIIENVIVAQQHRGCGLGKAVLKFAVNKAKELGCYKVALMTGSKRESTLKFYENAGFSPDKTGFQIRFDA